MKTFLKDCKWGTFLLLRGDTISQLTDIYGEWCEHEVALYDDLLTEDSNVVEVGSNIGMHAIPLSRFAFGGKVFCFEPQRVLFQILCANSALNNRTNIFAYQSAVGNEEKCLEIASTDYEQPWNYGAFSIDKGFSTEQNFQGSQWGEEVNIITIDNHSDIQKLDSVSLLKIDTEGFEMAVLDGARKLIERHKPAIFVENNNQETGDVLIKYFKDLGYVCYWYCVERAIADNYNRVSVKIPGGDLNMICFKKDSVPDNLNLAEVKSMSDIATGQIPWIQRDASKTPW
jgi:FkbM family methyltransferase